MTLSSPKPIRSPKESGLPVTFLEGDVPQGNLALPLGLGTGENYVVLQAPRYIKKLGVLKRDTPGLPGKGVNGSTAAREAFATTLSAALSMERQVVQAQPVVARIDTVTPETGEKLTFVPWVHGKTLAQEIPSDLDTATTESFLRLLAFELLIGNFDFHEENVLWRVEGQGKALIAIDHGLSMGTLPVEKEDLQFADPLRLMSSGFDATTSQFVANVDPAALAKLARHHFADEVVTRAMLARIEALQSAASSGKTLEEVVLLVWRAHCVATTPTTPSQHKRIEALQDKRQIVQQHVKRSKFAANAFAASGSHSLVQLRACFLFLVFLVSLFSWASCFKQPDILSTSSSLSPTSSSVPICKALPANLFNLQLHHLPTKAVVQLWLVSSTAKHTPFHVIMRVSTL